MVRVDQIPMSPAVTALVFSFARFLGFILLRLDGCNIFLEGCDGGCELLSLGRVCCLGGGEGGHVIRSCGRGCDEGVGSAFNFLTLIVDALVHEPTKIATVFGSLFLSKFCLGFKEMVLELLPRRALLV